MTFNIPPEIEKLGIRVARVLIAVVFLMNAIGVIDQSVPVKEMIARGVPATVAPIAGWAGRILELVAGIALVLGWRQRRAAIALVAFMVPATLVAHPFWLCSGTALLQPQLVNACKNVAIIGGLLFVASTRSAAPAPWWRRSSPAFSSERWSRRSPPDSGSPSPPCPTPRW